MTTKDKDSSAQAQPAGAARRDEQRVEGVLEHGLFALAILQDQEELPDLRRRGTD